MITPTQNLDQLRFGSLAALVARTWRKAIDHRLVQYNLSEATWLPLVYLSRLDKPVRQKDLAAMLSLDSSSVVRVLNNLEKLGFIERTAEEHDRRAKATRITDQGKEIIAHLESISRDLEQEIIQAFQPDDLQTARQVLKSMYLLLDSKPQLSDEDQP